MKYNPKWIFFLSLVLVMVFNISGICYANQLAGAEEVPAWEEEYTDTDSEKGILAVRCEAFQGFQGEVRVHFAGMTGGKTFIVTLDKDGDYLENLSLMREQYKVTSVTATSELREYDCHAEPEAVVVEANEISICKVFVNPDSIQRFPEETKKQQTNPTVETEMAEPEEKTEPAMPREPVKKESAQRKIPVSGILGIALILVCVGSLLYLHKREK